VGWERRGKRGEGEGRVRGGWWCGWCAERQGGGAVGRGIEGRGVRVREREGGLLGATCRIFQNVGRVGSTELTKKKIQLTSTQSS